MSVFHSVPHVRVSEKVERLSFKRESAVQAKSAKATRAPLKVSPPKNV